jgi:hypothetical protein
MLYILILGLWKHPGSSQSYNNNNRLHQNVKPANVHVLSYGAESAFDWEFKLADLVPSNSIKGVLLKGDAMANDSPDTCTYGV